MRTDTIVMQLVQAVIACLLTITLWPASSSGTLLEYAVQVEPVIFTKEPESKLLKDKEQLLLSCQARIAPLVSNQPLPAVSWLKDGVPIVNDGDVVITTNVSSGFSKLVIQETDTSSSGYYQCTANDANGRYITISRKAVVAVIAPEVPLPVTVELGQPLLLNCSPVLFGLSTNWTHNGVIVTNEWVLSTGSLFISSVTVDHQGVWGCYTTYNITLLPSSDEYYIPLAFVDINSTDISYGKTVHLNCVIAGLYPGTIIESVTWQLQTSKETTLLSMHELSGSGFDSEGSGTSTVVTYSITDFNDGHFGRYFCMFEVVLDNETLPINSSGLDIVASSGFPVVTSIPKIFDIFLELDMDNVELHCSFSSKVPSKVKWLKNGYVFNTSYTYNENMGILKLSKEVFSNNDLFGVYQCFIENDYGEDYTVNRILVKAHSNPPGNLIIKARTNISNFLQPYLDISWTPPAMRGDVNELSYSIQVLDVLDPQNFVTKLTLPSSSVNSTIIQLATDSTYSVVVSIYRPNIEGMKANCIIDSRERYFSVRKPFDYLFCTDDGRILFKWTPLGSNPSLYPAEFVTIEGTCLHDGQIFQFYDLIDEVYAPYSKQAFAERSPGTICEFYGRYRYGFILPYSLCGDEDVNFVDLATTYYEIPKKMCQVQDNFVFTADHDENVVKLSLICGTYELLIKWNVSSKMLCELSSNDSAILNVFGLCVHEDQVLKFNRTVDLVHNPLGQISFGNIEADSICSFGKPESLVSSSTLNYMISPAQCIIDPMLSSEYYNSPIQESSIDCSKHLRNSYSSNYPDFETMVIVPEGTPEGVPSGAPEGVPEGVPESSEKGGGTAGDVIITAVVAACFTVVIAMAVLLLLVIIFIFRRYKQSLKEAWSLNGFWVEEKIESDVFEEVCSLKTETDSLNYEGIQIGFKVYKGYTVEEIEHKPDTTGSSGYGSGYGSEATTQCSDYHSKKLDEVAEEDTDNASSLSAGSIEEEFSNQQSKDSAAAVRMCVYCSRMYYKRAGSVNNLKRLCVCEESEEYIRLAAGINRELVNQCDNQLNSRGTRLSTFSI